MLGAIIGRRMVARNSWLAHSMSPIPRILCSLRQRLESG